MAKSSLSTKLRKNHQNQYKTVTRHACVQFFFTKKFAGYLKAAMPRSYLCIVNEDEKSALLKGRKFFPSGEKKISLTGAGIQDLIDGFKYRRDVGLIPRVCEKYFYINP